MVSDFPEPAGTWDGSAIFGPLPSSLNALVPTTDRSGLDPDFRNLQVHPNPATASIFTIAGAGNGFFLKTTLLPRFVCCLL
jgi:hypothetical protein